MIPVCKDDEDVGSDELNHNVRQLGEDNWENDTIFLAAMVNFRYKPFTKW